MRRSFLVLFACVTSVPALVAQPVEKVNWTAGVAYTYDGTGNVAAIGNDKFVYDDVGRLVQAEVNGFKRNYTYDAFGNRKTCVPDCQFVFSINSANNRIAEATYDNGNPSGAGNVTTLLQPGKSPFLQHSYSYDALNVMTSDNALQFIYTADDERIATYVSGAGWWRWTVRDEKNKVLREFRSRNGSGGFARDGWTWTKDYVWREGALLASRQPRQPESNDTTTYHYHLDHLGTPRRITDDKEVVVAFHDYFAFGPEADNGKPEPSLTSLKYTGHERDGQDPPYSLDYMHARYYNNSLGRFLSVDPTWESADLGRPQSWNRYAYVMNNPVNMTDPDGKIPILVQVLVELATDFVTDGSPTGASADNPPRSQAEFDQRVAAGLAVRTYQAYTKTHPETGKVYSGRTSGTGTPEQNVARRDAGASHHKNAEGYGPAQLDKSSTNKDAIRGRAQQVLDANGGARSHGGTSGNAIEEISQKNPNRTKYIKEAVREFGEFLRKVF